ncbi:MAG TPA: methionine ABC transporter permease [Chthoniobacterales bacterium]
MALWFRDIDWGQIAQATLETLQMLSGSLVFVVVLGLPLGIVLFLTGNGQRWAQPGVYRGLSLLVNVIRSMPFVILLILLIPVTVAITGTSLGVVGAIPPLVIAAAPFFARLVETALREVEPGLIEAALAMGASDAQLIMAVLLPEARRGLIAAVTVTSIALVSDAAMSGAIGGGGLGDLAIRYGYQRFQTNVMVVTVLLLLALVQTLQFIGDRLVVHFSRK